MVGGKVLSLPFYIALPVSLLIFAVIRPRRAWISALAAYIVTMFIMFSVLAMAGHPVDWVWEFRYAVKEGRILKMMQIFFLDPSIGIMTAYLIVLGFKSLLRSRKS